MKKLNMERAAQLVQTIAREDRNSGYDLFEHFVYTFNWNLDAFALKCGYAIAELDCEDEQMMEWYDAETGAWSEAAPSEVA
jgi:hypothetical protein